MSITDTLHVLTTHKLRESWEVSHVESNSINNSSIFTARTQGG